VAKSGRPAHVLRAGERRREAGGSGPPRWRAPRTAVCAGDLRARRAASPSSAGGSVRVHGGRDTRQKGPIRVQEGWSGGVGGEQPRHGRLPDRHRHVGRTRRRTWRRRRVTGLGKRDDGARRPPASGTPYFAFVGDRPDRRVGPRARWPARRRLGGLEPPTLYRPNGHRGSKRQAVVCTQSPTPATPAASIEEGRWSGAPHGPTSPPNGPPGRSVRANGGARWSTPPVTRFREQRGTTNAQVGAGPARTSCRRSRSWAEQLVAEAVAGSCSDQRRARA
jgi:hypothetical protein